jgi:phosphatidylserine decarboxylase
LAKVAVGTKLEGTSLFISENDKKYKYTIFNGSEGEYFHWNEDFYFELFGVGVGEGENENSGVLIKFRIVEEGPKAVITIPYDSRSASPIYEILPEKQRRSIIAYGRLPLNLKDMGESFRRIELFEVSSDEKCGELAIGLHINKLIDIDTSNSEASPVILQPVGRKPNFLGISRIESTSTVSSATKPNAESNVVLNELEAKEVEVTSAEMIGRSPSPRYSMKSSNSGSSLREETDAQDEEELTAQISESFNLSANSEYGEILGLLNLEIVAAQRLPKEKRLLRSSGYAVNPFVTISFGKKSFKTKVKRNTANPIWKEKLAFSVKMTEMNYQVMFSIYDYENLGYNSCLATTNIRTSHFIRSPEQTLKLAIPLNLTRTHANLEEDACLLVKGSFLPYEKVRKIFWTKLLKAFDLNHNGFLCKLEFETMLESLGSTLSESTISKIFEAVEMTENQEISIEEAVKVLEDLTVHPPNSANSLENEEKVVILSHCPFCMKRWGSKQEEIDVITHLGICSASETSQMDKFVMGGFLTEEYASRKWFARLLSFMSFGNYRLGRNNGNILVQDRKTGKLIEEKMPTYIRLGIRMLHQNIVTYRTAVDFGYVRNIFQSLTIQQGQKYDHPSSINNIPHFIKYHKIPVHEIVDPLTSFKSFNEFFYRRIKLKEYRPVASPEDPFVTVSPADCRLNVFESVSDATKLWIKGINFNLISLLKDDKLAKYFDNGSLVIARLAPQDYHRFHSPVDGIVTMNYHIPGTYYTVNPMAVRQKVDVYTENARTITIIDSPQFGKVAFVSIGAMMVGSIIITAEIGAHVERLSEIGYFAFGGSTIVVLYSKEAQVQFDQDILANSKEQLETLVKVGESIGHKKKL